MLKKVAIFCGGPSSEHDVSLSSAKSILKNLDRKKYLPYVFFIKKDFKSAFYEAHSDIDYPKNTNFDDFSKVLKQNKNNFDIALLCALHGEFGEDGKIQEILEREKIIYTGSNSSSSKLCMDKYSSMEEVKSIKNLHLPKTTRINLTDKKMPAPPLKFPFVIKPNSLGSSVMVFITKNQSDFENALTEYKKHEIQEVLIQELIDGLEISCGCLEDRSGKTIPLPPIEIKPNASFFDYSAKYDVGGSEEITPPVSISKKESDKISNLAIEIHKKLECSTYTRSDFMYKNGKVYFLETNTLPGFTSTSLLPQESEAKNISFTDLIGFIIEESKNDY